MAKKNIEYDVCTAAIELIREATTKTIEVDNCQDCPFVVSDIDGYYGGCSIDEIYSEPAEDLPKDKVHEKCPLKLSNYKIKLK